MKHASRFAGAILWLSALPSAVRAEAWLKPALGTQTGTTDFELELEQRDADTDLTLRSLLAWPVDFVLVGLEGGVFLPAARTTDRFLIEGRLETNLGDPRGKMEDSDWISSRSEGIPTTRFAYTESSTDAHAFVTELSVGYRFGRLRERLRISVDLLAGSRQEYYALTARGAKGEAIGEDGEFMDVYVPAYEQAADYTVLHILPFVGSRVVYEPRPTFRLPLTARVHYLRSFSHDDHLLRNKEAFGRAYGTALSASLAPELSVRAPLSVGISAEAYYLTSFGGILEQEFYADDPSTPDDERDTDVPDSNFHVQSVRVQVMAFAKLSF